MDISLQTADDRAGGGGCSRPSVVRAKQQPKRNLDDSTLPTGRYQFRRAANRTGDDRRKRASPTGARSGRRCSSRNPGGPLLSTVFARRRAADHDLHAPFVTVDTSPPGIAEKSSRGARTVRGATSPITSPLGGYCFDRSYLSRCSLAAAILPAARVCTEPPDPGVNHRRQELRWAILQSIAAQTHFAQRAQDPNPAENNRGRWESVSAEEIIVGEHQGHVAGAPS